MNRTILDQSLYWKYFIGTPVVVLNWSYSATKDRHDSWWWCVSVVDNPTSTKIFVFDIFLSGTFNNDTTKFIYGFIHYTFTLGTVSLQKYVVKRYCFRNIETKSHRFRIYFPFVVSFHERSLRKYNYVIKGSRVERLKPSTPDSSTDPSSTPTDPTSDPSYNPTTNSDTDLRYPPLDYLDRSSTV